LKVVPAGYFKYPLLFGGDNKTWLSRFWKKAYRRLPEHKQPLLVRINHSRISLLPHHTSSGKEFYHHKEVNDDNCAQSKNQINSTASISSISSESMTKSSSPQVTRPIPVQRIKKVKKIEESSTVGSIIARSCPQPSIMPQSSGKSASLSEGYKGSPVLGEFSPEEESEIECLVGDLSDIDPSLEKSRTTTEQQSTDSTPFFPSTTTEKLVVSDMAPSANTSCPLAHSPDKDFSKAGDMKDAEQKNKQTAVLLDKETEINSSSLPVDKSTPKSSSIGEPAKKVVTEKTSMMEPSSDASKTPGSPEADHTPEKGENITRNEDPTTKKKSEESASKPDKEKKKPPPLKPKPKKLSLRGRSHQQETTQKSKKVGKLAPERLSKIEFHIPPPPGGANPVYTLPRKRSNTTPSRSDADVSSATDENRGLPSFVSEENILEKKLDFKNKRDSYHNAFDLNSSDDKKPTLKQDTSTLHVTSEGPPQSKNVEASSNAPGVKDEPHTPPTININVLNITIDEIKKQPLLQQPIVVSEGFLKKISNTFFKFWKKVF